ncbi:Ras GTPase-activating protein, partial [Reticulomyxa filosa]
HHVHAYTHKKKKKKNFSTSKKKKKKKVWEGMLIQVENSEEINIKDPNDPKIQQLCAERRERLCGFIRHIISQITNAESYPTGLRLLSSYLMELAKSKTYEQDNDKIANSLLGGFLFLRIFNPRIQIYGHEQARLNPKHAKLIRRRFTLIAKILQNISNQTMGGIKEPFMASLNDLIAEEIAKVQAFFTELCNVPPLTYYLDVDRKIRAKSPRDDFVYLSLGDLLFFKKILWADCKAAKANDGKHSPVETQYYQLVRRVHESDALLVAHDNKEESKGDERNGHNQEEEKKRGEKKEEEEKEEEEEEEEEQEDATDNDNDNGEDNDDDSDDDEKKGRRKNKGAKKKKVQAQKSGASYSRY